MRRLLRQSSLLTMLLIGLTSCSSGTWEDDDSNWKRAFNVDPPSDLKIRNSWYWRSHHFTVEHEYFFEIEYTDSLAALYTKGSDLLKIDVTEYDEIKFFNDKPKWFVPNSYEHYDIYKSKEFDNYFLFIDKRKRSIFFTQHQT